MHDVVFKKSSRGKTIVTKKPDTPHLRVICRANHAGAHLPRTQVPWSVSKVKWSKAQKDNRKRMRYSNNYAKAAMADPAVRAVYEKRAAKEGRVAYNVALSDYWKGKNLLGQETILPPQKNKKDGQASLSNLPKKPRKPNKAQQAEWDRITEAVTYAAAVLADPELCAYYEAEAEKLDMQPRNVAIADYLNGKNLLPK